MTQSLRIMRLMENNIEFDLHAVNGLVSPRSVSVRRLCLGRNCGRDVKAVRESLDKKRALGYSVHGNPNVCRKSRYLLTNEDVIEVQGPQTSGEVELVAVVDTGEVLITVGSDHNDRSVETMWTEALGKVFDTAKSKQMVPAVVAKDAWRYLDVRDNWDRLNLRSSVTVSDDRVPLQDFSLSDLVDLEHHFAANPWLREDGTVLFMGSSSMLPTVHLESYPQDFYFEVVDPVLHRTISHYYRVQSLEESGSRSL
jgi:hypothetical protein